MNVPTITMPREQAREKLHAYREQNRRRNDEEYQAAEVAFRRRCPAEFARSNPSWRIRREEKEHRSFEDGDEDEDDGEYAGDPFGMNMQD